MVQLDLVVFLGFIIIVALLVWYDRRNVKLTGLVIMRRTQRGRAFIERLTTRWPNFLSSFTTLGVIIALPMMVFISYFLVFNAVQLAGGADVGGVKLVLPWSGFEEHPGVIFVPWYFWIIGIMLVVVPHEFSHGIACRLSKIKIKSLGWMLLVFLPGAFVDPDKKQLDKAPRMAKLRVYAAGSFANLVSGFIFLLIGIALLGLMFTAHGIVPSGVIVESPAAAANLSGALIAIDGMPINSQDDFIAVMQRIPIGSEALVQTTSGNYTIITAQHPDLNQSYLGLAGPYQPYYVLNANVASSGLGDAAQFLVSLFSWLWIISVGIGMFNLLPIKPLDGGLMFEEIVSKFFSKKATRLITIGVSLALAAVVIFNIVGPALM